jgi:hypothetical protein
LILNSFRSGWDAARRGGVADAGGGGSVVTVLQEDGFHFGMAAKNAQKFRAAIATVTDNAS